MTTLTVCRCQLPPTVRERAINTFVDTFGGATRRDSEGYWRSPEGRLYIEPMDSWEVATDDPARFQAIASELASAVGEEAVYLTAGDTAQILALRD